eukprot:CAMPEP_0170949684 /NCGR_PEP_ID=MMETSP0735-20130129/29440_1 /TAXON_ID=186038 /ORGANISM="Fragilariopsis kerguelensis, Strain L26-C5" /LENGTH=216 /DNA_ID=CAMNT_0011359831 /DNA_START=407 /DNA_END=1057 /DNA_ORIENTATION=-
MTTVSSTIPAMPTMPTMNMPTMKMPSIPGPMPTPPTMPTLRQEFGTGNVVVDALSFQVVTHPHRSSRSQPPSMSPSLKRTEGLFQVSEGDNNNEEDEEFFFEYNTNDDKKLVEDLRRQFYVQKMMEKQQKKNRNTPSTSSSSTRTTPKSSSAMRMKSNDGDSDMDALLYKYGTSSPIFRILPQGMKEAADRLVSKMLSTISSRSASTTTAQQHKHA